MQVDLQAHLADIDDVLAIYARGTHTIDANGYAAMMLARTALRRAIAAEAELKQLKSGTYCAYCGHTEPIDGDGERIAEHIRTCEKHPMRAVEARVKELEAEIANLRDSAY